MSFLAAVAILCAAALVGGFLTDYTEFGAGLERAVRGRLPGEDR